jgi:charged multivesicular body protein 3
MEMMKVGVAAPIFMLKRSQSGIMEEMMEETLDGIDDDEIEEEADAEVDKVLFELTDGKLGQAGRVGADLPVSWGDYEKEPPQLTTQPQAEEEEENEAEMQRMQKEMQELLNG